MSDPKEGTLAFLVEKLDVGRDEVLVAQYKHGSLSGNEIAKAHEMFRHVLPPGVRIVFMDDRVDLKVVRAADLPMGFI